jgi:hypothetical protein
MPFVGPRRAQDEPWARLHAVVPRDLFRAEPEKTCRIIVKDVALLSRAEERRFLDGVYPWLDDPRPDHLVRPEHYTFAISGIHNSLESG